MLKTLTRTALPLLALTSLVWIAWAAPSAPSLSADAKALQEAPTEEEGVPQSQPGRGDDVVPLHAWPGEDRASLRMPDDLWERVREGLDVPANERVGFADEWMERFNPGDYCLGSVRQLYRDLRGVPDYTGYITSALINQASDPSLVLRTMYAVMDLRAACGIEAPGAESWGVEWIPEGAAPVDALDFVRMQGFPADRMGSLSREALAQWQSWPEPLQRLVIRLGVAVIEGMPYLQAAYDTAFLERALPGISTAEDDRERLYTLATAPWADEEGGPIPASFQLLDHVDRAYLAMGSVMVTRLVHGALVEYQTALTAEDAAWQLPTDANLAIETAWGPIRVTGLHDDEVREPALIHLDLGGNDTYLGPIASPRSLAAPVGIAVDLGGNDTYDTTSAGTSALASGLFGIGGLWDLAGDDMYRAGDSGIACGWYGTGLLVDAAGNDTYDSQGPWGQAAAYVGAGLLIDQAGDDTYSAGYCSQGFGGTWGMGALVDLAGDDVYEARQGMNISTAFGGRSISFCQGAAFGRRADFSDGHSLAGGIGLLADNSGDDHYTGAVYCQGTGYWWGLGILEDRAGNDVYNSEWYSQGSAPHFAIGCMVDLCGDDAYNWEHDALSQGVLAEARDAAVGVFIDGDGDDRYRYADRSVADANLNALALFWDRRGDDVYQPYFMRYPFDPMSAFGSATNYGQEGAGSFREEMPAYAVFLDTGGEDDYRPVVWAPNVTEPPAWHSLAGEDRHWSYPGIWQQRGFGADWQWYEGPQEQPQTQPGAGND